MVENEFEYIRGNTVINPKRKVQEKDKRKYEELEKAKKNRARRIIEEKKKNRKAIRHIAIFIVFMGILSIARDAKVFTMQNDLSSVNNQIDKYTDENEALRLDLLKNSSLDNIKTNAEESLNMKVATSEQLVAIDLSQNYFEELDIRDEEKQKAQKEEKGIFTRVMDALGF